MAGKTAFLTGITGQDGSYLAELLLVQGYEVHGLIIPGSSTGNLASCIRDVTLHEAVLEDADAIRQIVSSVKPDQFYHLAAQTFVAITADKESSMLASNTVATHALLSDLRSTVPGCRFVFAASAEIFGDASESPQTETTPIRPRSFYGITKAAAFMATRFYRESHGVPASSAILYNHESPRRGPQFVTRKITRTAVQIKLGQATELRLGNLDVVRDWGHAVDYVRALHMIATHPAADDYVIATGVPHTVRDFVTTAFGLLDLDWQKHVVVDQNFYRPAEKVPLVGCPDKAKRSLGWTPRASFEQIVREMVEADLAQASA